MILDHALQTRRLRLEPVTAGVAAAAAMGRAALGARIGAIAPEDWRGPYVFDRLRVVLDEQVIRYALAIHRDDRRVIGDVRFDRMAPGVYEIGYSVIAPYRRQGYATEAAGRIVRWLDEDVGAETIVAGCRMDNKPSIRTLRRLGFRLDGSTPNGRAFWWVLDRP
jgi:ribosomal-protein-alanine N-acetyltransferase